LFQVCDFPKSFFLNVLNNTVPGVPGYSIVWFIIIN
jgi:hypothetical protein